MIKHVASKGEKMKIGKEIWDDPEARDEYVNTMLWNQETFRTKFYHLEYDELSDFVKLGMEIHPRKGVRIAEHEIYTDESNTMWVPRFPLIESEGFKSGDRVRVTVEKIEPEEMTE